MHAEGITKSYGEKHVLTDFSADFSPTGVTWLMGQSGCGKTTLLRILAGLESYSGTLTGFDRPVSMVFQEDRLFEELTPLENCLLAGKISRQQASEYLLSTGLSEQDINKKTSALSGGMKRRTSIIRALCRTADIFLLDEPFGGIDMENRTAAAQTISRVCKGKAIIAVTHDIGDTELLHGRIIKMI